MFKYITLPPTRTYRRFAVPLVLVLVLQSSGIKTESVPTALAQGEPTEFTTHHDKIPNFCNSSTIQSIADGAWNDIATWSTGAVPGPSDRVSLMHSVTYDITTGDVDCLWIHDGGSLTFATDTDTTLQASNILVTKDGTLTVGTEQNPVDASVRAEIIIKDAPLNTGTIDAQTGLYAPPLGIADPAQWGTALLVIDGTITMHGSPLNRTFARTAVEPKAGDTTITLLTSESVIGWRAGDEIILPDSRSLKWNERDQTNKQNYVPQWEELTIQSVSSDGRTITITSPLAFDHPGGYDGDGTPTVIDGKPFLPHVMHMSRNVVVRSQTPAEAGKSRYCSEVDKLNDTDNCATRGHTSWLKHADTDVRYVRFADLGRTLFSRGFRPTQQNPVIDSTTFDSNGVPTHIGVNQIARYPIHTHHLVGALNTSAPAVACNDTDPVDPDNCQFALIGNAVHGGSADHNYRWGIAIHGSHYGLIKWNTVYNMQGAAIAAEDGTESENVFEDNMVVRVLGHGTRFNGGDDGIGHWYQGPNNYSRRNVASNIAQGKQYVYGFSITPEAVGTNNAGVFEIKIPRFQGDDPHMNGQVVDIQMLPIKQFEDNEAYGAMERGLTLWWIGARSGIAVRDIAPSTIKNLHVWNVYSRGVLMYQTRKVTYDGFVSRGDDQSNTSLVGIHYADYMNKESVIKNADIQGMGEGVSIPLYTDVHYFKDTSDQQGYFRIEDSHFKHNGRDITIQTPFTVGGSNHITDRHTTIKNTILESPTKVYMKFASGNFDPSDPQSKNSRNSNFLSKDEVYIEDYQGIPGENYRVYYHEQRPDRIMPQLLGEYDPDTRLGPRYTGCPDAGLTNSECMASYPNGIDFADPSPANADDIRHYDTIAIAGQISPCDQGDSQTCPNALNAPGNDPTDKFSGFENGDVFLSGSSATANICLQTELQPRKRKGHDHRLLRARVTITDQASSQEVANLNLPLDSLGRAFITDAGILAGIANDQSTLYDVTIKPSGFITRSALGATDLYNGCLDMGTAIVGDFNEDNNRVDLAELVLAVSFYRGVANALLADIYPLGMLLADLVELVGNYVNQG